MRHAQSRIRAFIEVREDEGYTEGFGHFWFDTLPRTGETVIVQYNEERRFLEVLSIDHRGFDEMSTRECGTNLFCKNRD